MYLATALVSQRYVRRFSDCVSGKFIEHAVGTLVVVRLKFIVAESYQGLGRSACAHIYDQLLRT